MNFFRRNWIKCIVSINFALSICLFFLKPEKYILLTGMMITQFVLAYSLFVFKRKLGIPIILTYFVYLLTGVVDELIPGGITQGKEKIDDILSVLGILAVIAVGYISYKLWKKGYW